VIMLSREAEERCGLGGESKVFDLNATLQAKPFTSLNNVQSNPRRCETCTTTASILQLLFLNIKTSLISVLSFHP